VNTGKNRSVINFLPVKPIFGKILEILSKKETPQRGAKRYYNNQQDL
jgi:hypothetical protein